METMELSKRGLDIESMECNDINDLIAGCNAAMVNYALSDRGKIIRVITFFNTKDSNLENISASHNYLCKNEYKFIISKNFMYTIKSFSNIKKSCIDFWAMLWKKVEGFTPPECTHDCTTNKRMDL